MRDAYNPHAAIGTGSIQILLKYARMHGMPINKALHQTRLSPSDCTQPEAILDAWQEVQIARNLMDYFGHPFLLGIEVGKLYQITSYGMWGLAMMSSATLKDAVSVGTRYLEITSRFNRVQVLAEGDNLVMALYDQHLPEDIRAFMSGRDLASLAVILETLLPRHPNCVHEIRLALPADDSYQPITALYPGHLKWNQRHHAIVMAKHLFDLPLPQANPATAALCEQQCRQQLERLSAQSGITGRVKSLLMQQLETAPSMERIATHLNTSPRTLRRQLVSEGSHWREIVLSVRMQLAERLLTETRLPLQAIAEQLGYADLSAFSHAFKRSRHTSPDHFRRRALHLSREPIAKQV
ncbi:MAG: AraC family transcriptional regulator ligand-binding domain-containing protein [Hahellaceae bacterium]|nr:AraC family transcriptional regulator ligand-binding domain-containing protein [Hahellaceae bacterium]MCP5170080.1 AraC family transcriptional regulator ligand-binding domain-containing protein [Hahellaceae bacterium]